MNFAERFALIFGAIAHFVYTRKCGIFFAKQADSIGQIENRLANKADKRNRANLIQKRINVAFEKKFGDLDFEKWRLRDERGGCSGGCRSRRGFNKLLNLSRRAQKYACRTKKANKLGRRDLESKRDCVENILHTSLFR